jgi:hypothetical protein
MRWHTLLGLFGTLVLAQASSPTPPVKKKTAAASQSGKAAAAPSTKARRTTRRVARKPAGPSYQLHPDTQRYSEIQKALTDRGYFHGEANGEWKDDSVDALKRFQADQKLPDDGKISSLTLIGLGLGPHHDGSTAATVPLPTAPNSEPPVSGSTVGPASSVTPKKDQPEKDQPPTTPPNQPPPRLN